MSKLEFDCLRSNIDIFIVNIKFIRFIVLAGRRVSIWWKTNFGDENNYDENVDVSSCGNDKLKLHLKQQYNFEFGNLKILSNPV